LSHELHCAVDNESHHSPGGYKATEILAAVNKLGISDDNKSKIVASGALKGYVALLGSSCTTEEQFLSAQGLWSLAMKCPEDVRKQENCVTGSFGHGFMIFSHYPYIVGCHNCQPVNQLITFFIFQGKC